VTGRPSPPWWSATGPRCCAPAGAPSAIPRPRRLPIWIGAAEATSLAARLHDVERPRPDTYRFAADLLDAAGAQLREVQVIRLAEMIFYAQAVLEDGTTVDARPSDAINLALVPGAEELRSRGSGA